MSGDRVDPLNRPVRVVLTFDQIKAVYELTIAKAVQLEANEDEARYGFGSERYRQAADALFAALCKGAREPCPACGGERVIHTDRPGATSPRPCPRCSRGGTR